MYKNPLESRSNIFLTGAAGTGKTYAINDYIINHPNTLLCASTGTAAVNISGSTAHRLFSIPVPAYGASPDKLTPSQLKVFEQAETVIIDEISMLRNDAFSFAVKVLRRAEKLYKKKIRLIVSGDFSQLAPIVKADEEKYFTKYGFDKSGFCFTTPEWEEMKFKVVELTEIKRQNDKTFIEQLSKARVGDTSCISYFNHFESDDRPDDAVYLCGTNKEADEINQEYLNSIDSPMVAYQATKQGITGKELPCDDIILLKKGCRVMFTANDTMIDADGNINLDFGDRNGTGRFTNGTMGTVLDAGSDFVLVKTDNEQEVYVEKHKWSVYKYTVNRQTQALQKDEIGSVLQIPLKVAKAITIHKSQGKTFTKAVISPRIFAAGQLYVALSRLTSSDGLYLTEVVTENAFKLSPVVDKFYQNGYTFAVSDAVKQKQKLIEKKLKSKATSKKKPANKAKKTTSRKKTTTSKKSTTKRALAKKTKK